MVWTDLTGQAHRIQARVNASLTSVPPPGPNAADTRAPPQGRLFLFGGDDGGQPHGDLWLYDVGSGAWSEPEIRGDKPTARSRHTLTLVRCHRDETMLEEDRLYLFGGVGVHTEDVMYLDLLRKEWVAPRTIGEAAVSLLGHTAAQVGMRLFIFGGRDSRKAYNTMWILDTGSHEWSTPLTMGTKPPPCSKHTMVAQGTRLYVALGEVSRDRVFVYETATDAWAQAEVALDTPAPPLSRSGAVLIGNELTTFGGMDDSTHELQNKVHLLDLPTMSW
jgi:hypothetical protein